MISSNISQLNKASKNLRKAKYIIDSLIKEETDAIACKEETK